MTWMINFAAAKWKTESTQRRCRCREGNLSCRTGMFQCKISEKLISCLIEGSRSSGSSWFRIMKALHASVPQFRIAFHSCRNIE